MSWNSLARSPRLMANMACCLLVGAWAPAHAVVDALVQESAALVQANQPAKAFELLSAREVERAGDPDFDLALGIAANQSGEFTRAIFALERVLAVQPDNTRAKAELARALFSVGDTRNARTLFEQSRAQGVPVEVGSVIDQFLQAIEKVDAEGRSSWRGQFDLGLGRDTNVTGGPSNGLVAVPAFGGIVVSLNPGAVERADSYFSANLGLSGRYVMDDPRWSLIGNGNLGLRSYLDVGGFDSQQINISGGVAYRVERHELSAVLQLEDYDVNGNTARRQSGLVGEWLYRFDAFRQFGSYLQYSQLTYPGQSTRDTDRTVLGASYAHLWRSGLLAYGGLYLGQEAAQTAGQDFQGHELSGFRLGVQQPMSADLSLFAALAYERRRFDGQNPLFLVTRRDRQTNVNLGLNWVVAKAWRLTPQVALTRSSSNISLNDYKRTVYSVNLRHDF